MPDNGLVEIKISRVIPAEKWRVIRLITKVWEFPSFVASVKEVSVIRKSGHTMRTRWKIEVEKIPVSWVEEDSLVLSHSAIHFKAVEGDLTEFNGQWQFRDTPEGTEVLITVYLKVDIPAIKDFVEAYVEKIVRRNFEAILEGVEKRLISLRYAGYKQGASDKIAGFGLIGHFYDFLHLERCLKILHPEFKMPSKEFIGQIFNITPSFKMVDVKDFKSKTGETVNGCAIVATFIPDMVEKDIWGIFSKVVKACKIAEKNGVGIVALGGYTSIVGERIGQHVNEHVDVAVTTGNTFTAAMAIDGVVKAAQLLEKDFSALKVAIVGGTGDIGSGCARALVDTVRQLTITGRTKANLKMMTAELARKRKARIIATMDNRSAVKDADIVIAVAASAQPILSLDWFKPGAIVCDVGYPKNISHAETDRQDILVFSGGLAKPPTRIVFPIDVGLPSSDTLYGCFSEAVILSLEKRFENYSFGRGNITPERIQEIRTLGAKHGFEVSDFYWGDKPVDASMLQRIKERASD